MINGAMYYVPTIRIKFSNIQKPFIVLYKTVLSPQLSPLSPLPLEECMGESGAIVADELLLVVVVVVISCLVRS